MYSFLKCFSLLLDKEAQECSLSIESRIPAAHNNPYAKIAYSDPPQVLMPFVAKRTVPTLLLLLSP